jgi:hypothetical protein
MHPLPGRFLLVLDHLSADRHIAAAVQDLRQALL